MGKTKEILVNYLGITIIITFLLVIMGGLWKPFAFVSYAAGQGKVSVSSAKIRQQADVNSAAIGSAMQGTTVTINDEVTGADGKVWYSVTVNDTNGYIRSDLIQKEENAGGTPEPTVDVTAVQPQSAVIAAGEEARVRSDASATNSQIITTIQAGMALTITGQAYGDDGNLWYQVNFMAESGEVNGFIRSDYVDLGEAQLVPADNAPAGEGNETPPPQETPSDTSVQDKTYEALLDNTDGEWYLIDRSKSEAGRYKITALFDAVEKNHDNYVESIATVKKQKITIIVLIILLVFVVLAATLLCFKMRDKMEDAYFASVEKETIKERRAEKPSGNNRKAMQKIGSDIERTTPIRANSGKPQIRQAAQKSQNITQGGSVAGKSSVRVKSAEQEQVKQAGQIRQITQTQKTVQPKKMQNQQEKIVKEQPRKVTPQKPKPRQVVPKREMQKAEDLSINTNSIMEEDDEFEFEFLNWDGDNN